MKKIIKTIYSYIQYPILISKLHSIGKNVFIRKGFSVEGHSGIDLGNNVRIGKNCRFECYSNGKRLGKIVVNDGCSFNHYTTILSGGDILIGQNTRFGSFVTILGESHGINPEKGIYHKQPLICKDVIIGEYVWVGEKVIIMPGVKIGDWSIIGAGAIVTKNIPAYSIAVGNPAKVIKQFNFETHRWEEPVK